MRADELATKSLFIGETPFDLLNNFQEFIDVEVTGIDVQEKTVLKQ